MIRAKPCLLYAFIGLLFCTFIQAQPGFAQRMITLDTEGCVLGLEALAKLTRAEVKTRIPVQKVGGRCRTGAVTLSGLGSGVTLQIDQMEWGAGAIAKLASATMPATLSLTLSGAQVTQAPAQTPVWSYLHTSVQTMDVQVLLGYSAVEKALHVHRAMVDFHDGNMVVLRAEFRNVAATLPDNPLLGSLSYLLDVLELEISTGITAPNPVWAMFFEEVRRNNPNLSDAALKDAAARVILRDLGAVLSKEARADVLALLADFPRATGDVHVSLTSTVGYALIRLAVLNFDTGLEAAFVGLGVDFTYGSPAP